MKRPFREHIIGQKRNVGRAFLAVLLLGAGFAAGWISNGRTRGETGSVREQRLGGHRYINPLLECESARDALENEMLQPFRRLIDERIDQWLKRPAIKEVAVYFRELNNGQNFGIHEHEKFFPASLIKIPLLVAYLKAAERDPLLLSRRLTYPGGPDETASQFFRPAVPLEPGRSYTVDELLHAMIVRSDNNAYHLLLPVLSPNVQQSVFRDLGLRSPWSVKGGAEDYVTVNEYASFFRILFNASYLSDVMSEKALSLLAEAEFAGGLKAGLPPGIPVADKFGEWTPMKNGESKQLHDCGVVYYPGQPYLLCVMSRGTSFSELSAVIADISRITFNEVNGRYRAF